MKHAMIGATVLALAVTAGMAAAKDLPEGGLSVQETADWLQSKGYRAEIGKDDTGDSRISSATQGVNFFVYFYDCKGNRCASIQFSAGFDIKGAYSLEKANDWNRNNRWAAATMDKDKDPWLSQDVDLSPGGTYENLKDEFGVWEDMLAKFLKTINWHS
jgi:hypothetical protein